MNDANTAQRTYTSCFPHGVDEKRRVQIPAKWRPEEEGTELTVIFWPQHQAGACLRVLPPVELAKLKATIEAMPNNDPSKVPLKRFIGSGSAQVSLDKAGRICLPEEMTAKAGIKDQAILVGLLDRFEIWNPDRYEQVKAADAIMATKALELIG
jgi:MraZ protein